MKKLLILSLLLCLLLQGCTLPSQVQDPVETTAEETVIHYILDEQSVHNAFSKALEVYGWFDICSMETDTSRSFDRNGITYYKTVNSEVSTYKELRTLVYSLFSVETGEKLLRENEENPPYIDYNGDLYCVDMARGADVTKG